MKILEQLNPDCVMAHTNLSVFYVSKGMIEEAEAYKYVEDDAAFRRYLKGRMATADRGGIVGF